MGKLSYQQRRLRTTDVSEFPPRATLQGSALQKRNGSSWLKSFSSRTFRNHSRTCSLCSRTENFYKLLVLAVGQPKKTLRAQYVSPRFFRKCLQPIWVKRPPCSIDKASDSILFTLWNMLAGQLLEKETRCRLRPARNFPKCQAARHCQHEEENQVADVLGACDRENLQRCYLQ